MNKKEIFNIIKTLDINNQIEINNIIKIFHEYKENEIRVKIIKKISSIKGNNYVEFFNYIVNGRYSEKVRKEATSGVGRRRDIEVAKKYLIEYLNDNNPEIQLQALRGLFVFKYDCFIKDEILKLYNKSNNEIIKYVISNEFKLNIIDFDTKESHIYVNPMYANKVIKGDSLKIMLGIQSNSIHLTFTSPPYYNARDYSIYSSYEEYLEFLTKIFDEVFQWL